MSALEQLKSAVLEYGTESYREGAGPKYTEGRLNGQEKLGRARAAAYARVVELAEQLAQPPAPCPAESSCWALDEDPAPLGEHPPVHRGDLARTAGGAA